MTSDTPTPHEAVAAEVRAELARQKIPQARLSALLEVSEVSVSRRLRGETPFTVNEVFLIATFLGIDVGQLLGSLAVRVGDEAAS